MYEEVGSTVSVFDRAYDDPVRVLDEGGEVVGDVPDLDDEALVEMYRDMRLARHFDGRAVSLQRQGRMGTYPPLSGQEGAQIGSATALDEDDWMVPSYREHGAALVRGLPLKQTLLYWMGHEAGNATPEGVNVFPVAVPIASQVPHATGAAWASKLRGENDAFLCYFGDGATSEGDFHEGVNFAACSIRRPSSSVTTTNGPSPCPASDRRGVRRWPRRRRRTGSTGYRSTGWTRWRCTASRRQPSRRRVTPRPTDLARR